jgi:hypothetical protein
MFLKLFLPCPISKVAEAYKKLSFQNLVKFFRLVHSVCFQFGWLSTKCNCAHCDIGVLRLWCRYDWDFLDISNSFWILNCLTISHGFTKDNDFLIHPPIKGRAITGWAACSHQLVLLQIRTSSHIHSKKFPSVFGGHLVFFCVIRLLRKRQHLYTYKRPYIAI